MRLSRTPAVYPCIGFQGNPGLTSLRVTQPRRYWNAAEGLGMHGLLQARMVLCSLRQGYGVDNTNVTSPQQALQASHHGQSVLLLMGVAVAGTLRQLYRNAMQMEVDFFSAQPGVSSAPSVGMLVIDFDDTCTVTDTTSLVFNTAIDATVEAAQGASCVLQHWQRKLHAACNYCCCCASAAWSLVRLWVTSLP